MDGAGYGRNIKNALITMVVLAAIGGGAVVGILVGIFS